MAICSVDARRSRSQDTEESEQLLSAPGFNIKPTAPEKLARLQVMKRHELVRRELSNGQLRFLYADVAVCRCL
jgi:hypothetical protein